MLKLREGEFKAILSYKVSLCQPVLQSECKASLGYIMRFCWGKRKREKEEENVWKGTCGVPEGERGGTGSLSGYVYWMHTSGKEDPFILKSNPRCRVGETVVLICASTISSSLGEQSICYWNR